LKGFLPIEQIARNKIEQYDSVSGIDIIGCNVIFFIIFFRMEYENGYHGDAT
jgi:hypothetical protein